MREFQGTGISWTARMTGKLNKSNAYMIAIDALQDGSGVEELATIWADSENDVRGMADATLIAASKDLLSALQECRDVLLICTILDKSGQVGVAVELADEVIARALDITPLKKSTPRLAK